MESIASAFGELRAARVAVVGDFFLDRYTESDLSRISPEAPVPILHVTNEYTKPGGAGNVVVNLRSLGAEVVVIGRVGDDLPGAQITDALDGLGADTSALTVEEGYNTPLKNRMLAGCQQLFSCGL